MGKQRARSKMPPSGFPLFWHRCKLITRLQGNFNTGRVDKTGIISLGTDSHKMELTTEAQDTDALAAKQVQAYRPAITDLVTFSRPIYIYIYIRSIIFPLQNHVFELLLVYSIELKRGPPEKNKTWCTSLPCCMNHSDFGDKLLGITDWSMYVYAKCTRKKT